MSLVVVPPGKDLVAALSLALSGADGWLSATGKVEGVELRVAGDGADPVRELRGRFTLASLSGPAGGPWGVVLSRASDVGLEVVAGELVQARSEGVTVWVASSAPATTGRAAARPREPEAEPAGWAAKASAHAEAKREAEWEDEPPLPQAGDLVQHFAFGLCEVLMAADEHLKIRDLKGPGRIREIRLGMLTVHGPTDKDGKKLFRLERKN